ncbi:MAG: hypothetical protein JXA71_12155, partial [Chitinispirillaceae bacterium]|nr:hypothetical protein [Chitinispirillaceae bacterium]
WVWDAVNTPEGVAGYFHCGMVACSSWTFFADHHGLKTGPWEMRLADASQSGDSRYRAVRKVRDHLFSVTFEWMVPWDSLEFDSGGAYTIHIAGESGCGDTLLPFTVRGMRNNEVNALPDRFVERAALIAVLLVLFIVLQVTMRKKKRRRGSLRRSA